MKKNIVFSFRAFDNNFRISSKQNKRLIGNGIKHSTTKDKIHQRGKEHFRSMNDSCHYHIDSNMNEFESVRSIGGSLTNSGRRDTRAHIIDVALENKNNDICNNI